MKYLQEHLLFFTLEMILWPLLVFFLMNFFLVIYYSYVFYLVFRKKSNKIKDEDNLILNLNSYLNLFYTFFWSCFFIPFIEINSGVLVVGANSFLQAYRNDNTYAHKPIWQVLISLFGMIMTLILCSLSAYCFRNYEFDGDNLIKKRFRSILFA